jgi:hypothetical protein
MNTSVLSNFKKHVKEKRNELKVNAEQYHQRNSISRLSYEESHREKSMLSLNKWENYRKARLFLQKKFKESKAKQKLVIKWIATVMLKKIIRFSMKKKLFLRVELEKTKKEYLNAKLVQRMARSQLWCKSKSIVERIGNELRYETLCKTTICHDYLYEHRAKDVIIWFLKNTIERKRIYSYILQFCNMIVKFQRNFRTHLELQRCRRDILEHFWTIEAQTMAFHEFKKGTPEYTNIEKFIK